MIFVCASLNHLTEACSCWHQTDAGLGTRSNLLRGSGETTMMASLAHHHPLRCRPDSALVIGVSLAQNKNRSEYVHLDLPEALLHNYASQTSTTLAMSLAKICASDRAFSAALASAQEHGAPR
jgi:hypothetical protein